MVFDIWWPKLEEKVTQELSKTEKPVLNSVSRTDRELLEELLPFLDQTLASVVPI